MNLSPREHTYYGDWVMTIETRRTFLKQTAATATLASLAMLGSSNAAEENQPPKTFKLGIVGLDTSHATVFAKQFNGGAANVPELNGFRITAAFPAGNPDFPLSKNRLAGFTAEVRKSGVEIVGSIAELLPLVDGILLESVDGTQHLEQARLVFAADKPVFIDKPLAASLKDVLAIAELGERHKVPWYTASSSRFTKGYPDLRQNAKIGEILGCDTYSQSRAAPAHPDLFWYGVHGVDLLYSLMGTGCHTVTAVQTPYSEQVTGTWKDGRIGTYRAIREHTGKTGLGSTVFGKEGIAHVNNYYDYIPLMTAIANFFRTGRSPIPTTEMVEIFTYLAAAETSKQRQGAPVSLADVTAEAKRA